MGAWPVDKYHLGKHLRSECRDGMLLLQPVPIQENPQQLHCPSPSVSFWHTVSHFHLYTRASRGRHGHYSKALSTPRLPNASSLLMFERCRDRLEHGHKGSGGSGGVEEAHDRGSAFRRATVAPTV